MDFVSYEKISAGFKQKETFFCLTPKAPTHQANHGKNLNLQKFFLYTMSGRSTSHLSHKKGEVNH